MINRVGVLDVGSNSVRLLVADVSDGQVFCVHTEKATTRLLAGYRDGMLDERAVERTARAIETLAGKARGMGAREVAGFGTSAMRDGANSAVLIGRAAFCGVTLEVLSGEQEAALSYAGAAPEGRRGVLDIGGGSTELLSGENGRVRASRSAQIGAVRLLEAAGGALRPDALVRAAREALAPAWRAVAPWPVDGWTGVGGTLTALATLCLTLTRYDPSRVEGYPLAYEPARAWLTRLCALPLETRMRIPGLSPERADILPCGTAILCAFFELSGAARIDVSDRDNLLGYVQMKNGKYQEQMKKT